MLKLDFCSYKSAKYACEKWHYSGCMPAGKTVKIGVWEDEKFIGCVIYSRGANNNQAKSFNVETSELAELARVALTTHKTTVSRILSISMKMLKKICPNLLLVFSYADETNQGHKGGIYKADNWEYLGKRVCTSGHLIVSGKLVHMRSINAKYGGPKNLPAGLTVKKPPPQTKHLFVKRFKPLCVSSKDSVAAGVQPEKGGAIPTDTLQSKS